MGYRQIALPHKFKIAVGGCPNNCVKHNLNDVGIVGWRGGYKMFIGGRFGKSHALGRPLGHVFEDEASVLDTVEKAILVFKKHGEQGERFCATINRLGLEEVERMIVSSEILQEKDAILGYRRQLGTALCQGAVRSSSGCGSVTRVQCQQQRFRFETRGSIVRCG